MKLYTGIILCVVVFLSSCANIKIVENDYVNIEVGYFKPSNIFESGSSLGLLISNPRNHTKIITQQK